MPHVRPGFAEHAKGTASISACIHFRLSTSRNIRPTLPRQSTSTCKAMSTSMGRLGAEWIVVHAGYHFTSDKEMRMTAGLERLKRVVDYAEKKNALILLENLNKEPADAEVHYLAHTVEEWRFYFERIRSSAFKLSFTVNHAHLVPEGIAG